MISTPQVYLPQNLTRLSKIDLARVELERRRRFDLIQQSEPLLKSLEKFTIAAWPVIEPGVQLKNNWHIGCIGEHLQAVSEHEIQQLLINIPPRHLKSTLVSVAWPVWEWINRPHTKFLFSAYAQVLSVRDSLKCRRLIQSPWFQARFGHRFQLTRDQSTKTRFDNEQGGYRIATSVGGSATGEGGDIVAVDDPHKADEVLSDVKRQGVLDWWDGTMSTRLNDPKTGAHVIIMQRLHELDLSGHVLEQGGYEHLCLPLEYEKDNTKTTVLGFVDPRTEENELLAKERYDRKDVEQLKMVLGKTQASGQLQQNPHAKGGNIVLESDIIKVQSLPAGPIIYKLQSIDTAFKETQAADYTVITTWVVIDIYFYLIDRWKEKAEYPKLVKAVKTQYIKHMPNKVIVEDKASGQSLIQTIKAIPREEMRIPVMQWQTGGLDKTARLRAVLNFFESHQIRVLDGQEWTQDWMNNMTRFPNMPHDDDVDSTTQALEYCRKARYGIPKLKHFDVMGR